MGWLRGERRHLRPRPADGVTRGGLLLAVGRPLPKLSSCRDLRGRAAIRTRRLARRIGQAVAASYVRRWKGHPQAAHALGRPSDALVLPGPTFRRAARPSRTPLDASPRGRGISGTESTAVWVADHRHLHGRSGRERPSRARTPLVEQGVGGSPSSALAAGSSPARRRRSSRSTGFRPSLVVWHGDERTSDGGWSASHTTAWAVGW